MGNRPTSRRLIIIFVLLLVAGLIGYAVGEVIDSYYQGYIQYQEKYGQ